MPKERKSRYNNKKLAQQYAWNSFSRYIKVRDNWTCYTCGAYMPKSRNMHAGHFIARTYTIYKFDERNVHAQCAGCNTFKYGSWEEYYPKMVAEYGREEIDYMLAHKNDYKQFTIKDYNAIEEYYNLKLEHLLNELTNS